jgi:hypothetical protein
MTAGFIPGESGISMDTIRTTLTGIQMLTIAMEQFAALVRAHRDHIRIAADTTPAAQFRLGFPNLIARATEDWLNLVTAAELRCGALDALDRAFMLQTHPDTAVRRYRHTPLALHRFLQAIFQDET